MKVSSIAIPENNPSFNGKLYIRNKVSNKTKLYKISRSADERIIKTFKNLFSIPITQKNPVEKYLATLKGIVGEEFIRELPALPLKVNNILSTSSNYASYISNNTFTQLNTDVFEISHDMH